MVVSGLNDVLIRHYTELTELIIALPAPAAHFHTR